MVPQNRKERRRSKPLGIVDTSLLEGLGGDGNGGVNLQGQHRIEEKD